MESGEETVLLYAVMRKSEWNKVKLPEGCYAKAFEAGPIESLCDVQTCKGWGALMAASVNRLAKKLCPVAGRLLDIRGPNA